MLVQAEKYANTKEGYDAYPVPSKVKAEQRLGNFRLVPTDQLTKETGGGP